MTISQLSAFRINRLEAQDENTSEVQALHLQLYNRDCVRV